MDGQLWFASWWPRSAFGYGFDRIQYARAQDCIFAKGHQFNPLKTGVWCHWGPVIGGVVKRGGRYDRDRVIRVSMDSDVSRP